MANLFAKHATILRLVGIVFVGLHVPLISVAVARFGFAVHDANTLLLVTFLGTLAGAVMTLPLLVMAAKQPA